uniref:Uncharacterized protein n=1 Tax=Arundo donax TaxID=35708 RepID=A0A0A9HL45_ARUDO
MYFDLLHENSNNVFILKTHPYHYIFYTFC